MKSKFEFEIRREEVFAAPYTESGSWQFCVGERGGAREGTPPPHRVRQRITHHAPAHVWGWNPSAIMVAHMHFSVNTTIDIRETLFGAL